MFAGKLSFVLAVLILAISVVIYRQSEEQTTKDTNEEEEETNEIFTKVTDTNEEEPNELISKEIDTNEEEEGGGEEEEETFEVPTTKGSDSNAEEDTNEEDSTKDSDTNEEEEEEEEETTEVSPEDIDPGFESDRYVFLAEWYDVEASLTRTYNLFYFTVDDTIELFDLKNQRIFLKRTSCDGVYLEDLYPGGTVKIYSRRMRIVDYGDDHTKTALTTKKQKTFGIIKPEAVEHMGKIIQIILRNDFRITNLKMARMTTEQASAFYREHEGRPFYPFLVEYMTSGPVIAMELMGEDAITRWREVIGPTDSEQARTDAPHSLRAMFGKDKSYNAVHGSTSEEGAQVEAAMFFPQDPLLKLQAPKTTAGFQDCTCCIVKPHAVKEGHLGDIIIEITDKDFKITAMEMLYLDQLQAEAFLEVYKSVVPEYPGMVSQLISGPCVAMEVTGQAGEGEEAVQRFRELVGPSCPEIARKLKPSSLRAMFGKDKLENAIHCSDLPEDGLLDVEYFFKLLESGQRPELTPDL